ncbi:hypothetical protein C7B80_10885 [Cyanosarcina cf. burmensis CCALA 770]|nr:hypothetical protein C7B80_10885 [Cyanosarcina cf. burmensis CCALA 770]
MEKWRRNVELFAFVAIFVVVIVLVTVSFDKQPQSREICSYTYLIHAVKRGEVAEIKISHDNSKALVEFKNSSSYSSYDPRPLGVVTVYLPEDHSLLSQVLRQSNVTIDFSPQTIEDFWFKALGFLFSLLPLMRILLLGRSVSDLKSSISDLKSSISNLSSQVKDFDKSKATVQEPQAQVTFKDVAGMDRAKLELKEVVDFLKNTDHFAADGTKIPQAILLAGSSGMDKTLLARAVAGEAGVPFLSISGSECVETFVGVGASRIRDLVEQAKSNVPCIVFIDEIDTVGGQRGAGLGSGNDMREQILNQLLTEMEGIKGKVGIIIIAATNRPDLLDLALLHSGRFDRQIVV